MQMPAPLPAHRAEVISIAPVENDIYLIFSGPHAAVDDKGSMAVGTLPLSAFRLDRKTAGELERLLADALHKKGGK
jgi:hypothetical protein